VTDPARPSRSVGHHRPMDDRRTTGDHRDDQALEERGLETRLAWAVMLLTLAVGSIMMVAR
jgi:hypothetical protein